MGVAAGVSVGGVNSLLYRYERADLQIRFRHRAGPAELEWRAVIQHALNKEPIVFEENQYQEDRMWLELEMKI